MGGVGWVGGIILGSNENKMYSLDSMHKIPHLKKTSTNHKKEKQNKKTQNIIHVSYYTHCESGFTSLVIFEYDT
jgi:hypothetical protein